MIRLILLSCVLVGCGASHRYSVSATNVGDQQVEMRVEQVHRGKRTVKMLTEIAPGTTSDYDYAMRSKHYVRCETRFTTPDGATALLDVANGDPLRVNVEAQDGQIVVTDRPE